MFNRSFNLNPQKQSVARVYNLASDGYDKPAVRFFPIIAKRLVELAQIQPGDTALDAGTGTGAAAMIASQVVGETGQVIGVDMAADMLTQAQAKKTSGHHRNVVFELGDIEALDHPDDSFDQVICASSIFFLSDMKGGLIEWRRVTKPGGHVAFNGYGDAAFRPLSDLFEARIRAYGVPLARPTNPFSWQRMTDPAEFRSLMSEAGFEDVQVCEEQLGYSLHNVEEWWDIIWNSGFRGPVSQLSTEDLKQFKTEHLAEVAKLQNGNGIWLDIPAIFCIGRK